MVARILLMNCIVGVACTPPSTGGGNKADTDFAPTGADSDTDLGCGEPQVELGEGYDQHGALQPGDPVVMVHGPQGGWHIDVSLRVTAFGEAVGISPLVTVIETGEQLAGDQTTDYVTLHPVSECTGETTGLRAFLDDPGDIDQERICALSGVGLRLSATVSDLSTYEMLEASVDVTAKLDPTDEEFACGL